MGTTKRILFMSLSLAWATMVWGESGSTEVRLSEGRSSTVAGTGLIIRAVRVIDFTSQGCEGGPRGCPDHVDLLVTHGKNRQAVTLYFAHTVAQKEQGINRKTLFGYDIVLVAISGREVKLNVQRAADNPKRP